MEVAEVKVIRLLNVQWREVQRYSEIFTRLKTASWMDGTWTIRTRDGQISSSTCPS